PNAAPRTTGSRAIAAGGLRRVNGPSFSTGRPRARPAWSKSGMPARTARASLARCRAIACFFSYRAASRTRSRLERPHTHIGDHVPAQGQPVALNQLRSLRHGEAEPLRCAVQPVAVGLLGREVVERVGPRVDFVEMPALRHDRDQDVTDVKRVAFYRIDANHMKAEARAHRLAELARREGPEPGEKLGIEPGPVALHPP